MGNALLLIVRGAVALSCGAAGVLVVTYWLVRRGSLAPFGPWARQVRRFTAWAVRPVERRLVRSGGNPQEAPYWVLGIAVIGGLVMISGTSWLVAYAGTLTYALHHGARSIAAFIVGSACDLLGIALLVRAIGSWFGLGPWHPWTRPFHRATDWLVAPIQRILPAAGMFDFSPVVAWLLVLLARNFLVTVIAG